MSSPTRTVLLTGERGTGKTTACLRLRARVLAAGLSCGGFLTLPVLSPGGQRLGLDLLAAADGERRGLASCVHDLGGPRIGPYSMRSATLAWGIDPVRAAAADLLFVDEIGPLELEQDQGFAPLRELLVTRPTDALLVVVRPSLVERVAADWNLPGAHRFETTTASRAGAPRELLHRLFPDLSSGTSSEVA